MKGLHRVVLSFVTATMFAPCFAFAAAAKNFSELAGSLVTLINTATGTIIIFGLVMYFYGIATNIPHFGDEDGAEKRKSFFFWGIIVLFVMVSIWGIVQLLQNTLFNGQYNPTTGPSTGTSGAFDTVGEPFQF